MQTTQQPKESGACRTCASVEQSLAGHILRASEHRQMKRRSVIFLSNAQMNLRANKSAWIVGRRLLAENGRRKSRSHSQSFTLEIALAGVHYCTTDRQFSRWSILDASVRSSVRVRTAMTTKSRKIKLFVNTSIQKPRGSSIEFQQRGRGNHPWQSCANGLHSVICKVSFNLEFQQLR